MVVCDSLTVQTLELWMLGCSPCFDLRSKDFVYICGDCKAFVETHTTRYFGYGT